MTTIGDVLLIFTLLTVSGLSLWGTMVATALIFPFRAAKYSQTLQNRGWSPIIAGFFLLIPALILILFLASVPNPVVKLLALLMLMVLLATAAIGGSGQVRLLADRVKASSGDISNYGAVTRASAMIILIFNIPVLGWFLMAPLSLMAGLGSIVLSGLKSAQNVPNPEIK